MEADLRAAQLAAWDEYQAAINDFCASAKVLVYVSQRLIESYPEKEDAGD